MVSCRDMTQVFASTVVAITMVATERATPAAELVASWAESSAGLELATSRTYLTNMKMPRLIVAAFSFVLKTAQLKKMPRPCAVESHVCCCKKLEELAEMPRPCAVESHVCCYKKLEELAEMPRPCAVESHARCYKKLEELAEMPRPCAVESHVCCYKKLEELSRCHGLAPWSLTFVATRNPKNY